MTRYNEVISERQKRARAVRDAVAERDGDVNSFGKEELMEMAGPKGLNLRMEPKATKAKLVFAISKHLGVATSAPATSDAN